MGNTLQSIEIRQLVKKYDGHCVLDIDALSFNPSKMYSVMGANGSGKTTLMKLISGIEGFESGEILKQDKTIRMIHPEIYLFQELSVIENVFMNRQKNFTKFGIRFMDWKGMKKEALAIMNQYGLNISVSKKVLQLERSVQKLLEIVIAMSYEPDCLILDEPFNYLDQNQAQLLKQLMMQYRDRGKIVICISHDMDDMLKIVDETIVLRNGKVAGSVTAEEAKERLDSGRNRYPKRRVELGEVIFQAEHIRDEQLNDISFVLHEGEILGIVGFKGAHKSHLGKVIFGLEKARGNIFVDGKKIRNKSTFHVVRKGICYIGSGSEGMFLNDTILNNITSANTKRMGQLDEQSKKIIAEYYMDMLNIHPDDSYERLSNLSSGNKQKVLLAKWFVSNSKIFIFNRPTAHVDVSSKVDIYNIFMDLAERKNGLILISNDLEEITGMCDAVLVMKNGEVVETLRDYDVSIENIMKHAK